MRISPRTDEVRTLVRKILTDLGVTNHEIDQLTETVRIEDGRCMARSYRADRFLAMWLIDVGILQFYDDEGNMVRRANLFVETEPRRMAA